MPYCKLAVYGLILGLGHAQTQTLPVLNGAGVDADALIFHRQEPVFHCSGFSEWMPLRTFRLSSHSSWIPTLKKTGVESATIRSYQESQTLFIALGPEADLKLGRFEENSTYTYQDSAAYAAGLHSVREGYPFGVLYHLLRTNTHGTHLDLLLDFKAVDKLEYSVGFRWKRPGLVGQPRYFNLECLHSFRDATDPFTFADMRPTGTGENLTGTYNGRYQSLSALTETRLGSSIWAASALYSWSRPKRPKGEYGFTDSSQSLRVGLHFQGSPILPSLWYAYTEGRTRSTGIRVPPGSEGSKRFHYALSSHSLQELRMASASRVLLPNSSTSLGMAGSYYSFQSQPPVDAMVQHKETLSYNRLGLSFIADMYGGFSRNGELIRLNGAVGQVEVSPRHEQRISTLRVALTLPLVFTWLDAALAGETHTQGLFSTDVDRVYGMAKRGRILSLTPRLAGEWQAYTWGHAELKIGAKASQSLFLWNDVANTNGTPAHQPPGSKQQSEYPPLANGFLGELSMALDF